jgi:PIN domain nuclease of toxin-antitoxin system
MESMIFLDTHVVVWLYAGELKLFKPATLKLINDHAIGISHIVRLELQYLYEIGRITKKPELIIDALVDEINLGFSTNSFERIVNQAIHFDFTRDPFDRIIVAEASINNSLLITKDKFIKKHYKHTVW